MKFTPHLCYDGSCAEAFQFYSRLIGGELQTLLTYGDSPWASDVPEEWHDKILHATLVLDGAELSGGDLRPGDYQRPQGFSVTASVPGKDEGRRIFDGLAQEGQIRVPFERTFWSPGFGVVIDRFDIPWELNSIA